jgi:hypothetical protein
MLLQYPNDYSDWQKLIEHCQTLEGLTPFERDKCKLAFELLRKELGEDFLAEAIKNNHPFSRYITNTAPWTRKRLIWFAEAINEIKIHSDYSKLVARLRDAAKFEEGLSVLEVAYKFSKVGFKLTFDRAVNIAGQSKVPDIHVLDGETKEEFYAEVSILGESVASKTAMETLQKLTEPLWHSVPFLHYCGRIHKVLSQKHLEEIVGVVSDSVIRTSKENGFREINIEGAIELGMATEASKDLLGKWATEKGLEIGQMTGPSINVDEVVRIGRKIDIEQKQLPNDKPNVVVIVNNDVFFRQPDITATINALEESVYEYPHLLATVVTGHYLGRGESKTLMRGQHGYIVKEGGGSYVEQHLILFNKFCGHKVYPAVITKIYNSFFRTF